jgi:hypothetical protein
VLGRNGGIGRRSGLKIRRPQGHESSSLSSGTSNGSGRKGKSGEEDEGSDGPGNFENHHAEPAQRRNKVLASVFASKMASIGRFHMAIPRMNVGKLPTELSSQMPLLSLMKERSMHFPSGTNIERRDS